MAPIKKKRTALDMFLPGPVEANPQPEAKETKPQLKERNETNFRAEIVNLARQNNSTTSASDEKAKYDISKYMLYLPLPVSEQLRTLHFEEQRGQVKKSKLHDYLMEAIDLLFKDRGLKSIDELLSE